MKAQTNSKTAQVHDPPDQTLNSLTANFAFQKLHLNVCETTEKRVEVEWVADYTI